MGQQRDCVEGFEMKTIKISNGVSTLNGKPINFINLSNIAWIGSVWYDQFEVGFVGGEVIWFKVEPQHEWSEEVVSGIFGSRTEYKMGKQINDPEKDIQKFYERLLNAMGVENEND